MAEMDLGSEMFGSPQASLTFCSPTTSATPHSTSNIISQFLNSSRSLFHEYGFQEEEDVLRSAATFQQQLLEVPQESSISPRRRVNRRIIPPPDILPTTRRSSFQSPFDESQHRYVLHAPADLSGMELLIACLQSQTCFNRLTTREQIESVLKEAYDHRGIVQYFYLYLLYLSYINLGLTNIFIPGLGFKIVVMLNFGFFQFVQDLYAVK